MAIADIGRRRVLASTIGGAAALLAAPALAAGDRRAKETTANEDLMREHGVLRRALMVYETVATRLREPHRAVDPRLVHQTAQLFRAFGEDYHERQLEEAFIFSRVVQVGGEAARLALILKAQHDRGRAITDYVMAQARRGALPDGERLALTLWEFVHMYRAHTAREDTIVFPAWKSSLSGGQYDEFGDRFEEIERQTFGHDGFDDAVRRIAAIETGLGIADLDRFTAPPPPRT